MQAVIFDMDGVIVDTNPTHHTAWHEYFARYDKPLTDADFLTYVSGKHNSQIVRHLFADKPLTDNEIQQLGDEKEALFRQLYEGIITPVPGIPAFLKALKEAGIKTAVGTSAPVENLDFVLDRLQLRQYFDVLLHERSITHPKPDPEVYQKAMSMLSVTPDESVIFEDSMTGIQAAKASGAYVVGVATTQSPDELRPFVNDVIRDFTEMTIARLQEGVGVA
jgi:beta-phosphoglucomutase family hydrolase